MMLAPVPLPDADCDLAVARRGDKDWRTDEGDPRSDFDSDHDKLFYAEALRRLEYVTQVVPAGAGYEFHSRAVHTHKVARLAYAIANRLLYAAVERGGVTSQRAAERVAVIKRFGGLDPVVAASGALIHDLGHAPFGHAGEQVLDRLARRVWGVPQGEADSLSFEGNAQSTRIVHSLEQHKYSETGISLANATVNAALKYPWSFAEGREKYSSYDSERPAIIEYRRYFEAELGNRRTLEAEIVDIADDITYAVHDVEDFYRAGLIPLQALKDGSAKVFGALVAGVQQTWVTQYRPALACLVDPDTAFSLGSEELLTAAEPAGLVQVRGLVGDVPTDAEVERCLQQKLFNLVPVREFTGDMESIAELREIVSSLINTLLKEVEFCEVFGVRLRREGRVLIVALKWLARQYVFELRALREEQEAQERRIEVVAEHFASILGLHLSRVLETESANRYRADQMESALVGRVLKAGRTSAGVSRLPVPPTWPHKYRSRFVTRMSALPADGDEAEAWSGSDAEQASRRDRGRLMLDAIASMSERELDQLADSLVVHRSRPLQTWQPGF